MRRRREEDATFSRMETRMNDYLDGIGDTILFIQASDINAIAGRERFMHVLCGLAASTNAIRQYRFIMDNALEATSGLSLPSPILSLRRRPKRRIEG